MSIHRNSIPLNGAHAPFAAPPPIELGDTHRRARSKPATASEPSQEPAEQPAQKTARPRAQTTNALWLKAAALLALIGVPAMAAPGDFGALAGDAPIDPVASDVAASFESAMAFEKPGMSFPGSAFYYLADPPEAALVALPESDPLERGAIGADAIGARIDAGPAARAFIAGSGTDYARAHDCLAQAIWYEAASESEAGQRAVAQVVLNRVAHPSWPSSVCGVVYEGSQRSTGCQFSFTCDGSLARRKPGALKGATWTAAQRIADQALNGSVYAAIGHATHYHTLWVDPYWAKTLDPVGVIGAHRFYRNRGRAGEIGAFTARYAGSEPAVNASASSRLETAAEGREELTERPPVLIAPEAILETAEAPQSARDTAAPDASTSSAAKPPVSNAGQPRKAFSRAGQWKVDPATLDLGRTQEPAPADANANADSGATADAPPTPEKP